jgi:acetylornithine/N-succinyldiaminopimelate aminotransferase
LGPLCFSPVDLEIFMATLIEAASPHVMNTYGRLPIALSHGQGCRVWDVNGREYLDAWVVLPSTPLGHNHPKLVARCRTRLTKIIHTSNYYHVPNGEEAGRQTGGAVRH